MWGEHHGDITSTRFCLRNNSDYHKCTKDICIVSENLLDYSLSLLHGIIPNSDLITPKLQCSSKPNEVDERQLLFDFFRLSLESTVGTYIGEEGS